MGAPPVLVEGRVVPRLSWHVWARLSTRTQNSKASRPLWGVSRRRCLKQQLLPIPGEQKTVGLNRVLMMIDAVAMRLLPTGEPGGFRRKEV